MLTGGAALAVWGDPIEHSRSPALHSAAYAVLGLDWAYGRRRVDAAGFDAALAALGPQWRGLSLTMPLKERAFAAAQVRDRHAALTGAVNTLLLDDRRPRGVNTDVGGIVRTLAERGIDGVGIARLVGAGATAASAVVALSELGARRIDAVARRPERVAPLIALGESLGVQVTATSLEAPALESAEITIATLPGGTVLPDAVADALADGGGLLLDAAYAPWPSQLARAWQDRGGSAVSGIEMLLHQALLQVRVFVAEDAASPLPDEADVLAAMRATLMGG